MSIASAIENAQQKVAAAYTAIENKGGTLPATQDLSNLSTTISDIPTAGTIDSLTVNPSTSQQTITASGGVDGYSPITVNAVTSSIDNNIAAENIKTGITILGVQGNYSGASINNQNKTIDTNGTYTADVGYTGLGTVTVDVDTVNNTSLSVTPSTSAQSFTPTTPYTGYSPVSVSAVTAAIDNNITASNIKDGVSILGVTGNVVELKGETRTEQLSSTAGGTFTPGAGKNGITSITVTPKNYNRGVSPSTTSAVYAVPNGYSGHGSITVNPVTSSIDANITAGNIKDGVSILGVTGTYSGSGSSKYGVTLDNLFGDVDADGVYQVPTTACSTFDLSSVKVFPSAASYSFYGLFVNKSCPTINLANCEYILADHLFDSFTAPGSSRSSFGTGTILINAPKLKYIVSANCFVNLFYSTENISSDVYYTFYLPKLEYINGSSACQRMFAYQPLRAPRLPSLLVCDGANSLQFAFSYNAYTDTQQGEHDNLIFQNLCYARGCNNMCSTSNYTSVAFNNLSSIPYANIFNGCFLGCSFLKSVYFNNLHPDSFNNNTNPFGTAMFNSSTASSVTDCTVHFPANMQSVISGLTGYPLFGGTSGKIVLAFDLPNVVTKTVSFSIAAGSHISSSFVNGRTVSVNSTTSLSLPKGLNCLHFSPTSTYTIGDSSWTLVVNGTEIDTKGAPYCKFEVTSTGLKFYGAGDTVTLTTTGYSATLSVEQYA